MLILYKGMLEKRSLEFLNSDELDINAKFQKWFSSLNSLLVDCSTRKSVTPRRETSQKP